MVFGRRLGHKIKIPQRYRLGHQSNPMIALNASNRVRYMVPLKLFFAGSPVRGEPCCAQCQAKATCCGTIQDVGHITWVSRNMVHLRVSCQLWIRISVCLGVLMLVFIVGGLKYPFEKYAQVGLDILPRIRGQQQPWLSHAPWINGEDHWVVEQNRLVTRAYHDIGLPSRLSF